jgi:hypothetical protein
MGRDVLHGQIEFGSGTSPGAHGKMRSHLIIGGSFGLTVEVELRALMGSLVGPLVGLPVVLSIIADIFSNVSLWFNMTPPDGTGRTARTSRLRVWLLTRSAREDDVADNSTHVNSVS